MQEVKKAGGEVPKLMIILDSAGNLATAKEIADAASGSDKSDMTRSKVLKSIFRIIMTPLADLKIPFIFTNHTYRTQDFISRQIAGGGTGPEYAASVVLMLNKAQLKESGDKVGIVVSAKPDKNRFAKPHPIKFHLHFTEGMNPYVGLEQYVSWDVCGITRGTIYKGEKKAFTPSSLLVAYSLSIHYTLLVASVLFLQLKQVVLYLFLPTLPSTLQYYHHTIY